MPGVGVAGAPCYRPPEMSSSSDHADSAAADSRKGAWTARVSLDCDRIEQQAWRSLRLDLYQQWMAAAEPMARVLSVPSCMLPDASLTQAGWC